MKSYQGEERRLSLRMPVCAEVKANAEGSESYYYTKDISATGTFLISETFPRLGVIMEIHISFPFLPEIMKLKGEVIRHHDYKEKDVYRHLRGFGLRFLAVRERDTKVIGDILKRVQSAMASRQKDID
jgi:hypothetical protein